MQQPGVNPDEREMERERERWSLMRAARDEADRSLALAANLADKEAALAHAHATIKEVSCFYLLQWLLNLNLANVALRKLVV